MFRGPYKILGDWTHIGSVQGKGPIHFTISPTLFFVLNNSFIEIKSHFLRLILLKCTFQYFLEYLESCHLSSLSNLRNFTCHRRNSVPITLQQFTYSPLLPYSTILKTLPLLSMFQNRIFLFWTFYINWIRP